MRKKSVAFTRDGGRQQDEFDLSSLLQSHEDVPAKMKTLGRDLVRRMAI
jgi:hypothetical protein